MGRADPVADPGIAGPANALVDVPGIAVGHHTVTGNGFQTGTTVVLAPDDGMVAGVDVRGGGPGTRETDLLHPTASVERIHALVLTGGSAYGLAACTGVMDGLAERRIGLPVGSGPHEVVPLVPAAVLFDLGRGGDFNARPDAGFGAAALEAARRDAESGQRTRPGAAQGNIGAGTGAAAGRLKGGIGTASVTLPGGITVGALVAVNPAGSPLDPRTGELLGARWLLPADGPPPARPSDRARDVLLTLTVPPPAAFRFRGRPSDPSDPETSDPEKFEKAPETRGPAENAANPDLIGNTTLVVVATDASLTKVECSKLAAVAQNGIARALNPVHTMFDGDVVFAAATGLAGTPDMAAFHQITVSGADVVTRAIVRAILAAETMTTPAGQWVSWSDAVARSR